MSVPEQNEQGSVGRSSSGGPLSPHGPMVLTYNSVSRFLADHGAVNPPVSQKYVNNQKNQFMMPFIYPVKYDSLPRDKTW